MKKKTNRQVFGKLKALTGLNTILLLLTVHFAHAQITNGLVAHYPFSGNPFDMVGTKHGTVHGAVLDTGRGGVPNAAYFFDGINDYIDFGNVDPVVANSDVTLCIWFKPFLSVVPGDTATIVNTVDNQYLFSTGGQTTSTGYTLLWAKGTVQGGRRTTSQWVATKHSPYVDNSWHHSCIVYKNTLNRMELYTDNVLKVDTPGGLASSSNVFRNIQAGKPNNSNSLYFEGLIDDIKIYNRALSALEIDTLCREFISCNSYKADTIVSCKAYTSPSGRYVWTNTGAYMDTVPNMGGCDSILTIHLEIDTVNISVGVTDSVLTSHAKSSRYQWLNCDSAYSVLVGDTNSTFKASLDGNYAVEVTSPLGGCVDTSSCYPLSCKKYATINEVRCTGTSYISPSGKYIWTQSGIYNDTLRTTGCDSILTISLTFQKIDTTITISGNVLVSNTNGMSYQWLDCDSGMVSIPGATNQVYTISRTGNYAVAISGKGCADTSACYQAIFTGMAEAGAKRIMLIYPNPSGGELYVDYSYWHSNTNPGLQLVDVKGRIVFQQDLSPSSGQGTIRLDLDLAAGNYILQFTSSGNVIESEKIIVQ